MHPLNAIMGIIVMSSLLVGTVNAASRQAPPVPSFTIQSVDIKFDGYCDGMHLEIVKGLIVGTRTGCDGARINGLEMSPNDTALDANVQLVATDYTYRLDSHNRFVVTYHGQLVNSGTWSYGVPDWRESDPTDRPSSLEP